MKGLLSLVMSCLALFPVTVDGQTPVLTCKRCTRAASLEQCTHTVVCRGDEICYMDEIITPELSIVYTSGCRTKTVCSGSLSSSVIVGKRYRQRRNDLIACSRCCDAIKKPGQLDCNARLCGIKYANTIASRCYLCDSRNGFAEQGNVDTPIQCLSETSCQADEACGVQRVDISGRDKHTYSCLPKRLCTLLTHEVLYRKEECYINPDPKLCSNNNFVGKRASTTLCTACCGDGLCNSGSCEQVIDRLYALWKGGVLDFNTLRQNGSLITTLGPSKSTTTMSTVTTRTTLKTSTALTSPTTMKTTTSPTTIKTTIKTTTPPTTPTTIKTTTPPTTPTKIKTTTPQTTPTTIKTTTPPPTSPTTSKTTTTTAPNTPTTSETTTTTAPNTPTTSETTATTAPNTPTTSETTTTTAPNTPTTSETTTTTAPNTPTTSETTTTTAPNTPTISETTTTTAPNTPTTSKTTTTTAPNTITTSEATTTTTAPNTQTTFEATTTLTIPQPNNTALIG